MHNNWYYSFSMALEDHGLKTVPIPMADYYDKDGKLQLGLYINFLKLRDVIIMPSFDTEEDDQAAQILQSKYCRPVIRINSRELAKKGGIINCVTWDK